MLAGLDGLPLGCRKACHGSSGQIDVLLSFPIIVLAMVVVAMLGKFVVAGVDLNLVVAIAIPIVPKVARVVRAAALSIREMPYIDAARAAGFGTSRIIFRHMAPNVFAPFLIMLTAFVAQAILLEASLPFSRPRRHRAGPRLGSDAVRQCRRLLSRGALDDRIPGARNLAVGVRIQSVRRRAARPPRPQVQDLTGSRRRAAGSDATGRPAAPNPTSRVSK
jgi:Binding-protein-dependent transport system inner membrane component